MSGSARLWTDKYWDHSVLRPRVLPRRNIDPRFRKERWVIGAFDPDRINKKSIRGLRIAILADCGVTLGLTVDEVAPVWVTVKVVVWGGSTFSVSPSDWSSSRETTPISAKIGGERLPAWEGGDVMDERSWLSISKFVSIWPKLPSDSVISVAPIVSSREKGVFWTKSASDLMITIPSTVGSCEKDVS